MEKSRSVRSLFARARAPLRSSFALGMLFGVACVSKTSPAPEPRSEVSTPPSAPARTEVPAAAPPPPSVPARTDVTAEADLKKELGALPESVLVGTDVTPLTEFLSAATSIPASGTFQSEQGGATAQVRLETGPGGMTLIREFADPGTKSQIKHYEALRSHAGGVRLSGKDLEVLGTGQSILVLEKGSGVDGIPDSLWIQYERTSSKTSTKGEGN